MYKGSKMSNGSAGSLLRNSVEKEMNGLARGLSGLSNGDVKAMIGFDLNGSVGGSPSGSVYGSHSASYNGSTNGSQGYPSDDEDDDGGDAFEEMIDALNELDTREVAAKAATATKASKTSSASTTTKQEDARERARRASRELKREKNDTSGGGRRSVKREHVIIKWIMKVTHKDKDMSIDFADWIRDGKILSLVMTTLCFNSVENDPYSNMGCSPEEKRIQQLRTQILDYGVDSKYIFTVEDVLLKRNTPKVVRCLEEVAKLAMQETHIKYDTLLNNKLYT